MAKELPYFKFEPNQWENGNIQMLSREDKGLFIDICSMYWSRLGDLPEKLVVQKVCNGNKDNLNNLIDEEIILIKNNIITISFLDDQLKEFNIKSKVNSENAISRWENVPERMKGNIVYVIRCWDDKEEFLKIGITTTSINRRFSGKLPYEFEALVVDYYENIELESQYKQIAKDYEYTTNKDFSGYFECYKIEALDVIMQFAKIRNAKFMRNVSETDAIREDEIKEDKKKEENNLPPTAFSMYRSLLDLGAEKQLINDWLKVRKTKKATNTKTALYGFISQVEKSNKDLNSILKICIENSWSGFKVSWLENLPKSESKIIPGETHEEKIRREYVERMTGKNKY